MGIKVLNLIYFQGYYFNELNNMFCLTVTLCMTHPFLKGHKFFKKSVLKI